MKTIITHFFNEEYFLPHWLNHHKKYFNHGILIDYDSTDESVNIIKEICPDWQIIKSKNEMFDAKKCDDEVMEIEQSISGFRICLNVTEFLIGNYKILDEENNFNKYFLIPSYVMVDTKEQMFTEVKNDLISERCNGLDFEKENNFRIRRARCFSNFNVNYPLGRHFENYDTDEFRILWYGAYSPFNDKSIKRKLQIQTRIPNQDKLNKHGYEHIKTESELLKDFEFYQNKSENLYNKIINLV